jgi:hypothetical protein
MLTLWDGTSLPTELKGELEREYPRLSMVEEQLRVSPTAAWPQTHRLFGQDAGDADAIAPQRRGRERQGPGRV